MLLLLVLSALLPGTVYCQAAPQDVKGSQDHPLVTRMPGYYIAHYKVVDFDQFTPVLVGGMRQKIVWEGKKYLIDYSAIDRKAKSSNLQIVRNYENALKSIGGTVINGDNLRMTAEVKKGDSVTGVHVRTANGGLDYEVTIVETKPMQQDVVADAAAMGRDITSTGKTVIYGIFFDTGKATIKTESEAALAEMAKLLQSTPPLKVYIVGHTDSVGTLESNLKLSADRADAVVKALVARGIGVGRLKASGVGPYSPVSTNKTEEGKAQNRRVELVEQ